MITINYKYIFLLSLLALKLNAGDMRALLFHGNCVTCHHETIAHSAPSITQVKEVYQSAFSTKEQFVNYMTQWVLKPNAQKSLMHQAINKYQLMPELAYDLDTLKEISAYIYETDFNKLDQKQNSRDY